MWLLENRRRKVTVLLVAVALFLLVLPGCVIKTRTGQEIKIAPPDRPEPKKTDEGKKEPAKDKTEDFTVLSEEEKVELSEGQADDPDKTAPEPEKQTGADSTIKPYDTEGIPEPTEEKMIEDDRPFHVTGNPRRDLPLQSTLYPVPALAENEIFNPEQRLREKRKASLELTREGRSALDAGNLELAIAKFQKAISIDPNNGAPYFYFAQARFLQKDWDQVITLADKAAVNLNKYPIFLSRAHLMKAQALANRKQYLQAIAACQTALDADSTNVQAKLLRTKLKNLY